MNRVHLPNNCLHPDYVAILPMTFENVLKYLQFDVDHIAIDKKFYEMACIN